MKKKMYAALLLAAALVVAPLGQLTGSIASASSNNSNRNVVTEAIDNSIGIKINQAVENAVATGAGTGTVTINGAEYGISTFGRNIMQKLNDAKVNAVITYDYKGNHYVITIPAGQAPVDENVPWCGPMYLYSKFFSTAVVTPIK